MGADACALAREGIVHKTTALMITLKTALADIAERIAAARARNIGQFMSASGSGVTLHSNAIKARAAAVDVTFFCVLAGPRAWRDAAWDVRIVGAARATPAWHGACALGCALNSFP
jgi:hypothetical protein